MHPETFEPLSVDEFCRAEVEPCAREADQAQITALARCLRQGVRVCYLDGSAGGGDGQANFVEMEVGEGEGVGEDPITLLYRVGASGRSAHALLTVPTRPQPGHYDVLDKDRPPTAAQINAAA